MLFFGDASEVLTPGVVQMLLILALLWWWCPRWVGPSAGRKLRTLIGLAFVWAWVFATPAIANLALRQLEGQPAVATMVPDRPATYVVLGAGTPARANSAGFAQLNLAGWRRIQAAVTHWQKSGGQLLLIGGLADQSAPEASSLAAMMGTLARQWGVPERAITLAGHNSQNTRQDLQAAQTALKAMSESMPGYLVTSAAHMPRSIGVAASLGLTFTPLPTDWRQLNNHSWRAWFPNNGGPAVWQLSLYELLGTVAYHWRGWL